MYILRNTTTDETFYACTDERRLGREAAKYADRTDIRIEFVRPTPPRGKGTR